MADGQVQQTPQPVNTGGQVPQGTPEAPPVADDFLAKTGFKSYEDAAKTLKEQHATITRLSQEKKQIEQALQATYQPATTAPPVKSGQGADFFDDPEGSVIRLAEQIAERKVSEKVQQLEAKQIIDRVRLENPKRFEELRPIAHQVYMEKPYLNNLGEEGLRQAMEEAESRRKSYLADLKAELFSTDDETTSGVPIDLKAQAKAEVLSEMQRAQGAMIPQGGVSRPISDDIKQKMQEATKKGDVDALLDLKLNNINF